MAATDPETGLTVKQENFAQLFVQLGNASEAYRQSYDVGEDTNPGTVWTEACLLLQNQKVSQRVKGLQQQIKDLGIVSVQQLTEELEDARQLAKDNKQSSAAVAAVMGKAKLHGHLTEKHEHTGAGGGPVQVVLANNDQELL